MIKENEVKSALGPRERSKVLRQFMAPLLVLTALFLLLWPQTLQAFLHVLFPSIDESVFPRSSLLVLVGEHLALSLSASFLAALLGVTLAVLATRRSGRIFLPLIRDMASLAQTFPPVAVLALAIPLLGFGFKPALLALILYSLLPVINNTLTGLETLPLPILEAAKGMGMGRFYVLMRVELPLALPIIGTGIRVSVIINVGTATLGALVGAGGLGTPIVAGLVRNNPAWVFQGSLVAGLLALILNVFLLAIERRFSHTENSHHPH